MGAAQLQCGLTLIPAQQTAQRQHDDRGERRTEQRVDAVEEQPDPAGGPARIEATRRCLADVDQRQRGVERRVGNDERRTPLGVGRVQHAEAGVYSVATGSRSTGTNG
jgi:hypothetical protein